VASSSTFVPGCQIVYLHTIDSNFGKFYGHLDYLRSFVIFCGNVVYFVSFWYIFFRFGMLCQEKFGYPDMQVHMRCVLLMFISGLPDCSWFNIPKRLKIYTKWPQNIPHDHKIYHMTTKYSKFLKIYQMVVKYTHIFLSKALQNIPKLGFLACKYTIICT
jgi:hypothetical protein